MSDSSQPVPVPRFEISLCMAGAISAGAYTAGVVDFLVEALEAWEAVRGQPDVPDHRVHLKGFAGASAGGIVGALATVALSGDNTPSPGTPRPPKWAHVPRLYQAWVTGPDMVPVPAMGGFSARPGFLGLDDLPTGIAAGQIPSILNGAVLNEIRDRCFTALGSAKPKPYIAEAFHAYLSLSNLRGIPYQISFPSNTQVYGMQDHGDRAHYRISGLGTAPTFPTMADFDTATELSAAEIPLAWRYPDGNRPPQPESWYGFAETTLATAAFPIGLPPRLLSVDLAGYTGRLFPSLSMETRITESRKLKPAWTLPGFEPSDWGEISPRPIVAVDGGMIDNDPFEYARMALIRLEKNSVGDWIGRRNPQGDRAADRAVIMVMPFPEPPGFLTKDTTLSPTLLFVLNRLVGTLINQSRFKAEELIAAADESVFSRFLISPRRGTPEGVETGAAAIASGLLGGFGGFTLEAFRDHDYQLGRRNCQQFLRESFVLHRENDVVAGWAKAAQQDPQDARFAKPAHPQDQTTARIIPLYGSAAVDVPKPVWPQMPGQTLDTLTGLVQVRLQALLPMLLTDAAPSLGGVGSVLRLLLKIPLIGRLIVSSLAAAGARCFRSMLTSDLKARQQG